MLAGIAGIIRFFEELANLLSGPLLTLGLGIALVDLLTDGALLTSVPLLLYVWAISQAVGVDAQLVATWDRARIAAREGRYWHLIGLLLLGAILAYVAWVAAQVFALQQSEGITTAQALTRLGMDSAAWLVQRTALSVALVALSGWTRYHAPAKDISLAAAHERERLEAELALEPLRAQRRMMQARGLRGVAAVALGKTPETGVDTATVIDSGTDASTSQDSANAAHNDASDERPPTGPGTPVQRPRQRPRPRRASPAAVINLPEPTEWRTKRQNGTTGTTGRARQSVEMQARAVYKPGMSAKRLASEAGIGLSAASKYRRLLAAEVTATTPTPAHDDSARLERIAQ